MKTLTVVIEKGDSGNYGATVPKLPGCIAIGDTIDEVKQEIREAINFHLEGLAEMGEIPKGITPDNLTFEYKLDLPSFSKAFNWINISALAEKAGLNKSLVRQYTTGAKYPSEKQAGILQEAIKQLANDLSQVQLI